jgi:hypothetical protein
MASNRMARFEQPQGFAGTARTFAGHCGSAARAFPTWLPAPPSRRSYPGSWAAPREPATRVRRLTLPATQEPLGERLLFAALALAALTGVAYGLTNLLDLVQNWSSVNVAVAQLIQ